jgi:natural product biosynthesis luciferase-like monooxygenase protein
VECDSRTAGSDQRLLRARSAVVTTKSTAIVAFVGDESLVVQCAQLCRDAGHPVSFVSSRSHELRRRAAELGFETIDPGELPRRLASTPTNVLFSIANERVLGDDVLSEVDVAINFHDGPLPEYAGLAVTSWAIFKGATEHAVTWHTMTSTVDAGSIVLEHRFAIAEDESAFSLNARCYEAALETFPRVLDEATTGHRDFRPQRSGDRRWFGRYDRPIALLDPAVAADDLGRAARAYDLGPRFRNRVGSLRWVVGDDVVLAGATRLLPPGTEAPGTVLFTSDGPRLRTAAGDLLFVEVTAANGDELGIDRLQELLPGSATSPPDHLVQALNAADPTFARHETAWVQRLTEFQPFEPTHIESSPDAEWQDIEVPVRTDTAASDIASGVLAWWTRTSGSDIAWFTYSDERTEQVHRSLTPLTARPLGRCRLAAEIDWLGLHASIETEFEWLSEHGPYLRDLVARTPAVRHRVIEPALHLHVGALESAPDDTRARCLAVIIPNGGTLRLRIRSSAPVARRVAEQIASILHAGHARPDELVRRAQLIGPNERAVLDGWNDTGFDYDRSTTVDAEFRRQVAATPGAPAVTSAGGTLTYAELARDVEVFSSRLSEKGASRGSLVGIAVERDTDLLVAVLAVLSIGAAYVPLDPTYPRERLAYMVSDADLAVVVADDATAEGLSESDLVVLSPRDRSATPSQRHGSDHGPSDLAYVIYTSGSTGRPKGVMLEHRNVTNFFAAMDDVIDHDPAGVWLAVTSLSFDISVLELLWTVTRGFHVVIQRHGITSAAAAPRLGATGGRASRSTSLSLFFFAAGEAQASDGYRLLRESAVYGDRNGFEAVWLPERHFHQFGGAYPNPSVLGAAVAASTNNIAIRAGSVVLPLHSSARVAEEWAVVDNLSGGRVGISFAPGWQPNDFVLNPNGYRTAREDLPTRIDEVRALWRGDAVDMVGPDEQVVSVRTLPRPVQPELPIWLTSAGTTATFEKAGSDGLNLLTHLLGQSIEQLADNIAVYRAAWTAAGHEGDGHVTVMLHTFLDHDTARAKQLAAGPLKQYLGTATGLLKNMASTFPTFAKAGASADEAFRSLTDSEMDELLTVAAERYLGTSGLFGSIEDATEMARSLADIGTDEIACLIDFGVDTDLVLE